MAFRLLCTQLSFHSTLLTRLLFFGVVLFSYIYIGYKAYFSTCLDHVYCQFLLYLLLACTVDKTFSR